MMGINVSSTLFFKRSKKWEDISHSFFTVPFPCPWRYPQVNLELFPLGLMFLIILPFKNSLPITKHPADDTSWRFLYFLWRRSPSSGCVFYFLLFGLNDRCSPEIHTTYMTFAPEEGFQHDETWSAWIWNIRGGEKLSVFKIRHSFFYSCL